MTAADVGTLVGVYFGAFVVGYVVGTVLRVFRQFAEKV